MLCLSSNKRQTPTWKRKFKVGDELERNKRIELHAKVTSLSGKLRKAFLASDESGDSKLQPDEVKEMLHKWGKDLKDDEISLLENFLWKADRNGDGVLEYDEFVNRLAEFEQSLQFDRANQVSHEAMTALVNSKLWKEIERNRREIIAEMARSATSGIRSMSKGEVWEALGRVKGMKFTDEIKEWFIAAANTWDEERFNAGSLFDRSSEAGGFDIANFNFMRDTVKDLRPTHMSPEKLAEYKAKALARMERMRPKIENLISKLTLQVGNSLHRAFRALDDNKTGVLNAEKIYNGFKRHGVKISEEEAGEIVQACDINGDGHIELIDFQNLFTDEVKATVDVDRNRSLVVRSAAIPSLVLQQMRENGGKTERKWFSQFHQGDWSGPFKEVDYSSPSRCDGTARYDRVSAPQRVDQRVLERACRDMALNASWRTSSSPDVLSGSSLFDEQRTRASNVVEQAKAQRRLQHERHIDDLIRSYEKRIDHRLQATIATKAKQRVEWLQRCYDAVARMEHPVGPPPPPPQLLDPSSLTTLTPLLPPWFPLLSPSFTRPCNPRPSSLPLHTLPSLPPFPSSPALPRSHVNFVIYRTARPWSSPTCDMLSELRPASSSCSSENHLSLKCAAVLLLVLDMCRKKMKERIKTKVAITAKMI
mmetsp:Transcript_39197/g.123601  ORF Transcript_39197/g.123601 Transcript_39197/m.123601 type:complete len:650 (-) Transcript_39197:178-2127(-)